VLQIDQAKTFQKANDGFSFNFALRLPILFAPLREMYFSFGDISRKGAKAYLSRKENQSKTQPDLDGTCGPL
jgi:hypothetical protein